LVKAETARIDDAVTAGRIDADKAVTLKDGLEAKITERVNQTPPADGQGRGGRMDGFGHRGPGMDAAVLTDLGLDPAALRTAMESGSTLAEAAAAQGVSESDLVAALVKAETARIDDAVTAGRIDADEAVTLKDGLEAKITERVNQTPPADGQGRGGRMDGFGHRGGHGPWDGADDAPAPAAPDA
jgi:hypothetical protein